LKTAVYNVRVDLIAVATLHRHYTAQGLAIPSVSTLTRRSLEMLSNMVTDQLGAKPFNTIAEAVNYLEDSGLMKPLRSRGNNAIVRGMQEESLQLDGLSTDYLKRKGVSNVSEDQLSAAKAALKQVQEEKSSGAVLGPKLGETK
jgi:hypothetical protein